MGGDADGIAAASIITAHTSARLTGFAFIIFTASSLMWIGFAYSENDNAGWFRIWC